MRKVSACAIHTTTTYQCNYMYGKSCSWFRQKSVAPYILCDYCLIGQCTFGPAQRSAILQTRNNRGKSKS